MRECFRGHRPNPDQLLAVLTGEELVRAFDELPRIQNHHDRGATLAALMHHAGAAGEPSTLLVDSHVLDHLPAGYNQPELFAVIGASAWWIHRQSGITAGRSTIDAILDTVRR